MDLFRTKNRHRSITLEEVASAAGVSRPTASVILNKARSGTRVSEETRNRVLEVAAELGYRPNAVAQHLASGRANRIGFYSGRSKLDCRNPFFAEVLGGVFDGAESHQLDTVVHTSGSDHLHIVDLVRGHTLDGLIVHAVTNDPILGYLGELRVPAVAIADRLERLPSVTVDDNRGGQILAEHLAQLGHRHILVKQSPELLRSAFDRVASFLGVCESRGLKVTMAQEIFVGDALSDDDLRTLTQIPDRATAIMAWSDAVAVTLCDHLDRLRISVPQEVSVVGFDGFLFRHGPRYDITTVRAPWSLVGREAVRVLADQVAGKPVPELTVLPVELYQGNTTIRVF
jgi:DNA-binding LacI/PurR family transcriptional regulator